MQDARIKAWPHQTSFPVVLLSSLTRSSSFSISHLEKEVKVNIWATPYFTIFPAIYKIAVVLNYYIFLDDSSVYYHLPWLHFLCMSHPKPWAWHEKNQNMLFLLGLVCIYSHQTSLVIAKATFRARFYSAQVKGAGLVVVQELSWIAAGSKHERGRTLLVSLKS